MGWETRARGGHYYCRSIRIGGRVRRIYIGGGILGKLAAEMDAIARAERAKAAAEWAATRATLAEADRPLATFNEVVARFAHTTLEAAGYCRHNRGEWRRKRMTTHGMPAVETALTEDPAAFTQLLEQAGSGDKRALSQVSEFIDTVAGGWEALADLGLEAERVWVALAAGDNPLLEEALKHKLARLRDELAGPAPSPLEQLLVDRIVLNWLALQHADEEAGRFFRDGGPLTHAVFHQDRQERAQRRYLAAVKALAQVRRLLGATVQINVAHQQVNVAV